MPSRAARGEGAAGGSKGSSGRAAQGPVLVGGSETCVAPRGLPAARPAGSWAADQVSTGQDPAHQAVRPRWTEQGTWDPRPHAWIPSQKPPRVIRARSRRMTPKTRDFRTWLSASVGEPTARGPGTGRPEEPRGSLSWGLGPEGLGSDGSRTETSLRRGDTGGSGCLHTCVPSSCGAGLSGSAR